MMMGRIHKYKQKKVTEMKGYLHKPANTSSLRASPERLQLHPSKDVSLVLPKSKKIS